MRRRRASHRQRRGRRLPGRGRRVVAVPVASFTVKVADPATQSDWLRRPARSTLPNGFAHVNVVLVTAGSIGGTVFAADGHTPAGAGARVESSRARNLLPVARRRSFTDANGAYEFPIVSLGHLRRRGVRCGRQPRPLDAAGDRVERPARSTRRSPISDAASSPAPCATAPATRQPNVPMTLTATSLFGQAPIVGGNSAPDGTFRFDNVLVGAFTVQARDPLTNLVGTVTGRSRPTCRSSHRRHARDSGARCRARFIARRHHAGRGRHRVGDRAGRDFFDDDRRRRTLRVRVPAARRLLRNRAGAGHAWDGVRARARCQSTRRQSRQNLTLRPQGTLVVTVTDAASHRSPARSFAYPVPRAGRRFARSDRRRRRRSPDRARPRIAERVDRRHGRRLVGQPHHDAAAERDQADHRRTSSRPGASSGPFFRQTARHPRRASRCRARAAAAP